MKELSIISIFFLFLIFGCSGSKEFDETPTPIGGEEKMRSVFKEALGSQFAEMEGKVEVTFNIYTYEDGSVKDVTINSENREFDNYKHTFIPLVRAMKTNIKFTPATKDGKRVKAKFPYTFYF